MRHELAAACLLALASLPVTAGEKKPLETKAAKSGVELTVRIDEGEFPTSGRPVTLSISLTNRREEMVHYYVSGSKYSSYKLVVQDEWRKPVPETRFGKGSSMTAPTLELRPGETRTLTFNLARLYDFTVPGPYSLKVIKSVDLSPTETVKLETEPLRFVVCGPCPAEWPLPPSGWPNPHRLRDWRARGMSERDEWREEPGDEPETPRPVAPDRRGDEPPLPSAGAEGERSLSPVAAAGAGLVAGVAIGLAVGLLIAARRRMVGARGGGRDET